MSDMLGLLSQLIKRVEALKEENRALKKELKKLKKPERSSPQTPSKPSKKETTPSLF